MNFLFFASVFAVIVSSNPLGPLFADPVSFVQTFADADPEVIQKMLGLEAELEKEGEDDRAAVIADAAAKLSVSEAKNSALASAETSLSAAQTSLAAAKGVKNELIVREEVERASLAAATSVLDASQKDADKKKASMESITARVTHENEEFDKVLDLLDQVVVPAEFLETGRKLLSFTDADPDAVASVKAQVVALKEAADKEAADSVDLNNAAQDKLAVDTATHDSALSTHTATAGQLQVAILDCQAKTKVRNDAQVERDEAATAASLAAANSADADAFRDSEISRIDTELVTLKQVKALLESLL